jgi:Flp pilus assembly protein CpaB
VSRHHVALSVRVRRTLAHPGARRAIVAVLALTTGLVAASLVRSADAARDRWGATRPVAVAIRDLQPGDTIDGASAELRDLPQAAAGPAALGEVPDGAVVRHPIMAGEALVAERLAPEGLTGVAALVAPGQRAVAIPVGPTGAPPLSVGDRVDVLAVIATGTGTSGGEPAFPVVESGLVVDVAEQAISVAVPEPDAARVAWAVGNGVVVLALSGG